MAGRRGRQPNYPKGAQAEFSRTFPRFGVLLKPEQERMLDVLCLADDRSRSYIIGKLVEKDFAARGLTLSLDEPAEAHPVEA